MNKKEYLVENMGCDDTTYAVLKLTQKEFEFLNNIFEQINKNSSYSCQPVINFDIEAKVEKIEGYEDERDYVQKTNDYSGRIKKIGGKLYKINY